MRVLFITSAYPANADDPRGTFIHVLARSLVEEGMDITVLAPGAPSAPTSEVRHGVQIRRATYWIPRWQSLATGLGGIVPNLRVKPWLIFQVPALIAALSWQAIRLVRQSDLIHAHWVFPSGIAGAIARLMSGKPLIMTSHGGDLNLAKRSGVLRWLVRVTVCRADHCIGVSNALASALGEYGIDPASVSHIPYGVRLGADVESQTVTDDQNLRRFRAFTSLKVIYIGSMIPRKSVMTLLDAASIARRSDVLAAYAFVGTGPELRRLRERAAKDGGLEVIFAGEQKPSGIVNWLAAADVLVLPSLSEGRPLVVLEAFAMSRAVVATDIPGTRELVRHSWNGLLFQPGDATMLAGHIQRLAASRAESLRMGRNGQALVLAEGLEAGAIARRHITLYRALTERTGRYPAEQAAGMQS